MTSQKVIVTLRNGVRYIKLNSPKNKNAMCPNMYTALADTLNTDAANDNVVVTILTGCGEYYCSGFDIKSAVTEVNVTGKDAVNSKLKDMISAFINYPKLIISLVNGPAIGIGVTTAALCDIIYASDRATFHTPFINIGLCAEGASSYNFPRILGRSKASEMILLGKKITAQEAYGFGLVAQVIPHDKLEEFTLQLENYGNLPVNSVKINKKLIMEHYKDNLCKANEREIDQLKECTDSEEFSNAVMNFMTRKQSKL